MDVGNERKAAATESLFRETNEGIARGLWPDERDKRVPFRCECSSPQCAETVALSQAQYEQVRTNPRRFIVTPGHEVADLEVTVESHPDYLIVEKLAEAAVVAEELDPRSSKRPSQGVDRDSPTR